MFLSSKLLMQLNNQLILIVLFNTYKSNVTVCGNR